MRVVARARVEDAAAARRTGARRAAATRAPAAAACAASARAAVGELRRGLADGRARAAQRSRSATAGSSSLKRASPARPRPAPPARAGARSSVSASSSISSSSSPTVIGRAALERRAQVGGGDHGWVGGRSPCARGLRSGRGGETGRGATRDPARRVPADQRHAGCSPRRLRRETLPPGAPRARPLHGQRAPGADGGAARGPRRDRDRRLAPRAAHRAAQRAPERRPGARRCAAPARAGGRRALRRDRLQPAVRARRGRTTLPRRGPRRAWEAGPDGRALLDRILAAAPAHLRAGRPPARRPLLASSGSSRRTERALEAARPRGRHRRPRRAARSGP